MVLCFFAHVLFLLLLLLDPVRHPRLVPGKILLGKYPGQIPADLPGEPRRQLARDRVLDIVLRGGVTDLFCLQVFFSYFGSPALLGYVFQHSSSGEVVKVPNEHRARESYLDFCRLECRLVFVSYLSHARF